jgi:hypothetical protein
MCVTTLPHISPLSGKTQGETLQEYFDTLVTAASTNENIPVELTAASMSTKLVESNAKLSNANETLGSKLNKASGGRSNARRRNRLKNFVLT